MESKARNVERQREDIIVKYVDVLNDFLNTIVCNINVNQVAGSKFQKQLMTFFKQINFIDTAPGANPL